MQTVLKTKFGTAKLQQHGYYIITSRKEGNSNKRLHRLIWEDFYNCKIPDGYVIHHKNGIKTDNCILNLQLMRESDHNYLHNINKTWSEETRKKISKNHADVSGKNNPRAKYTLWDIKTVKYDKTKMFRYGNDKGLCPRKCFQLKYKGKKIPIGLFHDFKTVEIVNDLISSIIDEEEKKGVDINV